MKEPLLLEIHRYGDRFVLTVSVREPVAGTLRRCSEREFSARQLSAVSGQILSLLWAACRRPEADSRVRLQKLGLLLWEQVFTPEVSRTLSDGCGSLCLLIDEELEAVPWELAWDAGQFLCCRFPVGRLLRTRSASARTALQHTGSARRMLVLADPTGNLPRAYQEGLSIRAQSGLRDFRIDFLSSQADIISVKRALREYDIVHFAGHCEFDGEDPEGGGWVMCDGRLCVRDILVMSPEVRLPELVFSNACLSAAGVPEDRARYACSLASAFLRSGVRHYIGSILPVEDASGAVFAREFYLRLCAGHPVGECVLRAREALMKHNGESLSWAGYVLYGDPEFIFLSRRNPGILKAFSKIFRLPLEIFKK